MVEGRGQHSWHTVGMACQIPWPRPAAFQFLMSISSADFIREEAWEDNQAGLSVNKRMGSWGRGEGGVLRAQKGLNWKVLHMAEDLSGA